MSAEALELILPVSTPNRGKLIEGAREGFLLPSSGQAQVEAEGWEVRNYSSAKMFARELEDHLRRERSLGRVEETVHPPTAALAVLRKPSGAIRVITDLSLRVAGQRMGANGTIGAEDLPEMRLPSSRTLVQEMSASPDHLVAAVDIREAYRHIRTRCRPGGAAIRYSVGPVTVVDRALPMGHAASAGIMQSVLEAIAYALKARFPQLEVFAYLDDVLLKGPPGVVREAYGVLVQWLLDLHLPPAWEKLQAPASSVVYLGFLIDCVASVIAVTVDRAEKLLRLLHILRRQLDKASDVTAEMCTAARKLAGKIGFLQSVVPPIRALIRGLEVLGACAPDVPRRDAPVSKCATGDQESHSAPPSSPGLRVEPADVGRRSKQQAFCLRQGRAMTLRWSHALARVLARPMQRPFPAETLPPEPGTCDYRVWSDASTSGGGIVVEDKAGKLTWIYVAFDAIPAKRITFAEAAMPALGFRLGLFPRGARVHWFLDNSASVHSFAQWHARSFQLANIVAATAERVLELEAEVSWSFVPGHTNVRADALSRMPPTPTIAQLERAFGGGDGRQAAFRVIHMPANLTRWVHVE